MRNDSSNPIILNDSMISVCENVTNEQASERQFVVNHVLEQSHHTSINKSQVWSDVPSSLM